MIGRTEKVVVSLALLLFSLALTSSFWPNLHLLPGTESSDWFQQLAFDYSMVDAVRNHGEFPLWNPFFGGGIPWAGYIANAGLTPISLVIIAVGEVVAIKVLILVTMLLAGYGMYATCREWLSLDIAPALLAGLIYVGSSKLAGELADGNYVNLALFTLPFFAFCLLRLLQRRWLGVLLPFLYMTALAEGKYASLIIAGTLLPFALAYRAAAHQTKASVVTAWALSLGAGLAFGAPKLLPLFELMQMDLVDQTSYHAGAHYSLVSLITSLVGVRPEVEFLWLSVGYVGVALALAGILADWRRSLGLNALLLLFAALAMGPASPLPLWRLARVLPVMNSLNSEGKYFSVSVLFCICGLLALGAQRVLAVTLSWIARTSSAPARVQGTIIACLCLAALAQPVAQSWPVFQKLFHAENSVPVRQPFHHVAAGDLLGVVDRYRATEPPSLLYDQTRSGIGTITWYGNMVFPENPKAKVLLPINNEPEMQAGYRGELYCAEALNCAANDLRLTYNTIQFHVESAGPADVVINLNYHRGWSAGIGEVVNREGLIAVRIPSGHRGQVDLRFRDARFLVGCVVLATSLVVWFVGVAHATRVRRLSSAPDARARRARA